VLSASGKVAPAEQSTVPSSRAGISSARLDTAGVDVLFRLASEIYAFSSARAPPPDSYAFLSPGVSNNHQLGIRILLHLSATSSNSALQCYRPATASWRSDKRTRYLARRGGGGGGGGDC